MPFLFSLLSLLLFFSRRVNVWPLQNCDSITLCGSYVRKEMQISKRTNFYMMITSGVDLDFLSKFQLLCSEKSIRTVASKILAMQ